MKRLTVPQGMPAAAHSAWRVALRRAAHQVFDEPLIFRDPLAVPLLGAAGAEALRRTPAAGRRVWSRSLRAFVVARSAFAEEALHTAYGRGVRQLCLLGAGLDTFAWRSPWEDLHVWELDLPAVQQWKQELAAEAGFALPPRCERVATDFGEADTNGAEADEGWSVGSLDLQQPVFFSLLGVAPFLDAGALGRLLGRVRRCPRGSVLVLDYRLPRYAMGPEEQRQHDSLQARATAAGEPFQEGWTPEAMRQELLGAHAFARCQDLGREELNARYFTGRADGLSLRGEAARIVVAEV